MCCLFFLGLGKAGPIWSPDFLKMAWQDHRHTSCLEIAQKDHAPAFEILPWYASSISMIWWFDCVPKWVHAITKSSGCKTCEGTPFQMFNPAAWFDLSRFWWWEVIWRWTDADFAFKILVLQRMILLKKCLKTILCWRLSFGIFLLGAVNQNLVPLLSGNRTWQWKMDHLSVIFLYTSIC